MDEDERCCGTGTCLINAEGLCWCGQQWDGTTMCRPTAPAVLEEAAPKLGAIVHPGNRQQESAHCS
jgi:hypothetical protein